MVYGTYNELVTGAYKPTQVSWGPHIVYIYMAMERNHETWGTYEENYRENMGKL